MTIAAVSVLGGLTPTSDEPTVGSDSVDLYGYRDLLTGDERSPLAELRHVLETEVAEGDP